MADKLQSTIQQLGEFLKVQKNSVPADTYQGMINAHVETIKGNISKLAQLSPEEATSLSTCLRSGPWQDHHKTEISMLLSQKLANSSVAESGQSKTQDCLHFGAFLSKGDRDVLKEASNSESQKLDQLAARCWKIGLFLPNESTKGRIVTCEVAAGLQVDSAQAFYEALKTFKRIMKKKREMVPGRTVFELSSYPDGPQHLPDRLKESYTTDPAAGLSMEEMMRMSRVQTLRKSSKALQNNLAPQSSTSSMAPFAGLGQGDPMQMLVGCLMHCAKALAGAHGDDDEGGLPGLQLFKPAKKGQKQKPLGSTTVKDGSAEASEASQPGQPSQPLLALPDPGLVVPKEAEEQENGKGPETDADPEEQLSWHLKKKPAAAKATASQIRMKPAAASAKTTAKASTVAKAKAKVSPAAKAKAHAKASPKASNDVIKTIRKRSGWVVEFRRKRTCGSLYGKWISPTGQIYKSAVQAAPFGFDQDPPRSSYCRVFFIVSNLCRNNKISICL